MRYSISCALALAMAAACAAESDNEPPPDDPGGGGGGNVDVCVADAPVCEGDGPNNGCEPGFVCNTTCVCEAEIVPPPDILARPSRSTAIDITKDDRVIAMVNSDNGSVSFFNATEGQESRISRVNTSEASAASEPVAVVIHPDQNQAYVANRATGSIAKIEDIGGTSARLTRELELGGEVVGLALSPSGAQLWATNWTLRTVTVIDTATFQVSRTISLPGQPFAIAISNDGDTEDTDEKVIVTDFYARKIDGETSEGVDGGRNGRVWFIDIGGNTAREVNLAPIANCFEGKIGDNDVRSGCFINQLNSVTIHEAFGRTYAYVTSVAASPAGPVNFNHNVQAVVSVISLATESERPELSHNLNTFVAQQVDDDGDDKVGRRFMNVPNSIAFVNRNDVAIAYVTSAGSDIVLRVEWDADNSFSIGAPSALNIPVGQNPLGIQIRHKTGDAAAYTANLISRDLSILSFRDQRTLRVVESTPVPTAGSPDFDAWRGKRFFNTSTGIWSKEGWGSCQACHPMGLTDNVTWKFAAGPRQTIALDGQFASNDPSDMRALNWTAIFDETADFENNTRGVSGGEGAIRDTNGPLQSASGARFSALPAGDGSDETENHQALNGSLNFVINNPDICSNPQTCPDWRQIDEYIQTIRSPVGRSVDANLIQEGRDVFKDGGCDKCHAGPKWTVSRTFYTPELFSGEVPNRQFEVDRLGSVEIDTGVLVGLPLDVNVDQFLIDGDDSDGGAPAFKRQACNLRIVGTFGTSGGADETRANGGDAQGKNGFNPPSLLGAITGAPFLHHGAAADLADLFDSRFSAHTESGNANFRPSPDELRALIAFIESIDENTTPFDILPATVLCPSL